MSLDDFPPYRRGDLLRRYGHWYGWEREQLDDSVRLSAARPCSLPSKLLEPSLTVWSTTTPIGKLAHRLLALFGQQCAICDVNKAVVIDHDHDTGFVRGLLCHQCNKWVDFCLHLDGCPYADYLAAPPAASLQIRYPNRYRKPRKPPLDAEALKAKREAIATWQAEQREGRGLRRP